MFRSGWGTKEGQEVTLAIRLQRKAFDAILAAAVHSSYIPQLYSTEEEWKRQVARSDVRLQWDPDHGPTGQPLERRAVQLGLRGEFVKRYSKEWILAIEDISDFVAIQRELVNQRRLDELTTLMENEYVVNDLAVAQKLGITAQ